MILAEQTYIEGTEPFVIPAVDDAYKALKDKELEIANSKEERDELRKELIELLDQNAATIEKHCGERGYVFEYKGEHRAIALKPGSVALTDRKVKVEKNPDDENESDEDA